MPLKDLAAKTEALALQIADASRFVLAIGKQGFYAQVDQPDNSAMHYAKNTITMNLSEEDAQIGIESFLIKRRRFGEIDNISNGCCQSGTLINRPPGIQLNGECRPADQMDRHPCILQPLSKIFF